MKDQIFRGPDVSGAVDAAAQALGVSPAHLRYVVLDKGSAGRLGVGTTPASIAVLAVGAAPVPAPGPPAETPVGGFAANLRGLVRTLAEAASIDLGAEVEEESGDTLHVRLHGPGCAFLLEEEGEVFRALEHILQRIASRDRIRVRVECPGYRDRREEDLRGQALALAQSVRGDGQPRTTGPLNSYERRLIHVTLSNEPDLETFSVGEGAERRVTVARKPAVPPVEG